jgi:hypothetical protein
MQNLYRHVLLSQRKIGAVAIQGFEYHALAAVSQSLYENIPIP